jgi:Protein of unknown function (DUF2523)
MPYLIMILMGALTRFLPYIVAKLFAAFGIGLFTYGGIILLFDSLKFQLNTYFSNLPHDALTLLDMGGITHAIAIALGAISTKLALKAATLTLRKL